VQVRLLKSVDQYSREAWRDLLPRSGYEVEWHSYPMEHAVHPLEIQHVGQWMRKVLAD
jgi:phospholipase/carboxylesterase